MDHWWARVAALFEQAVERDPAERPAFLRQAAGADSDLRRQVEGLLSEDGSQHLIDTGIPHEAVEWLIDNDAVRAGSTLGAYTIEGLIGIGGMGEVYRARDTRLNREVAIKILPPAFAADAERVARFKREAQVLASLNHPNIAAIYGFEEAGDVDALVLEFVEGPTLADRIARGPLPLDEALAIARQIADALECAHEQGVVHRDLKPANIKVRDDGTVKVLDFGLAKMAESPAGRGPHGASTTQSPTITTPAMTAAGIILGTAAYMSPEQAKGKPADKRSDIWAFGCVLYEMLTGRRAFDGDDVAETLAAVLRSEPDMGLLPRTVPPLVYTALTECFAKSPAVRLSGVAALRFALAHPLGQEQPTSRRSLWAAGTAVGLVAILSVVAAIGFSRRAVPASRGVVRSSLLLPEGEQFSGTNAELVALSPDGRRIAYVANARINLRSVDSLESTVVRGTEGLGATNDSSRLPFFSPDGEWLGFWQANQFKKVSVHGGTPSVIVDGMSTTTRALVVARASLGGASWANDDTILIGGQDVWRLPSAGGAMAKVLHLAADAVARSPTLLPDGNHLLFTLVRDQDPAHPDIVVHALASGERRTIIRGGADAHYVDAGYIVYFSDGTIFAVPFDAATLTVTGSPTAIVNHVARGPFNQASVGHFSVARDGTLVYVAETAVGTGRQQLVFVGRDRREYPIDAPSRPYIYPRISPDDSKIAVHIQDGQLDLWSVDVAHGNLTKLTNMPGRELYPVWADPRHVLFGAGTPPNIWRVDADGGAPPERLSESASDAQLPGSMLPDRSGVLVTIGAPSDIALVSFRDGGKSTTLLHSNAAYRNPELSPDGRWLAYQTNESGQFEIEVRPFPHIASGRVQVSHGGGTQPGWSAKGDELLYVAAGGGLMSVSVAPGSGWNTTGPRRILDGPYTWSQQDVTGRLWDLTSDRKRFLLMKPDPSSPREPATIVLVQNAVGRSAK